MVDWTDDSSQCNSGKYIKSDSDVFIPGSFTGGYWKWIIIVYKDFLTGPVRRPLARSLHHVNELTRNNTIRLLARV